MIPSRSKKIDVSGIVKKMVQEKDPLGSKDAVVVIKRISDSGIPLSAISKAEQIISFPFHGIEGSSIQDLLNTVEQDLVSRAVNLIKAVAAIRMIQKFIFGGHGSGGI